MKCDHGVGLGKRYAIGERARYPRTPVTSRERDECAQAAFSDGPSTASIAAGGALGAPGRFLRHSGR